MAKLVLLFALCVLPAIAFASRPVGVRPLFTVQGKVYCDTCQAGFETPVTTYIPGNPLFLFVVPLVGILYI